jgi:repressor LexA
MESNKYIKIFAERLKGLRADSGLSVRELGQAVGVSGPTISRYENAEIEPRKTAIQALANYFKVNPTWLMGAEVEKYLDDVKQCSYKEVPILEKVNTSPIGYEMVQDNEIDYCLKVNDDSMAGARIHEGDIAYIMKSSDYDSGEIVVVVIDDNESLRRLYKVNGSVILRAENPRFEDKVFSKKDFKHIRISGKVKSIKFNI